MIQTVVSSKTLELRIGIIYSGISQLEDRRIQLWTIRKLYRREGAIDIMSAGFESLSGLALFA